MNNNVIFVNKSTIMNGIVGIRITNIFIVTNVCDIRWISKGIKTPVYPITVREVQNKAKKVWI